LVFGVAADQALTSGDVVRSPELDGLKSNEVAVMLPVSLASSDEVQPNDRVNVIWLGGSSSTSSAIAPGTVIATGLRVLTVLNQNGAPVTPASDANGLSASTPAVVEVAVPQAEAGNLALAASSGRFWLALNPWAGPQDAVSSVVNDGAFSASQIPSSQLPNGAGVLPHQSPSSGGTSPGTTLGHGGIPPTHSTVLPTTHTSSPGATSGHVVISPTHSTAPLTTHASSPKLSKTGGHHD